MVGPEPTLNRRSMGHTLEENGKWGSWRGWPGKDGIPPHNLSLSLVFVLFLAAVSSSPPSYSMLSCSLILPLPPADPAAHPLPRSPSFLRYLISFSHPPLVTSEPPHPTEPAEGARLPSSLIPRSQSRALRHRHANEGHPATGQVCEPQWKTL